MYKISSIFIVSKNIFSSTTELTIVKLFKPVNFLKLEAAIFVLYDKSSAETFDTRFADETFSLDILAEEAELEEHLTNNPDKEIVVEASKSKRHEIPGQKQIQEYRFSISEA